MRTLTLLGLGLAVASCQSDRGTGPSSVAPTLASLTPASGAPGASVHVSLTGTDFVAGATSVTVSGAGVAADSVSVESPTSLTADFVIASSAAPGSRTVTVTTAGGTSGAETFTVSAPAPTLTSVSPASGVEGGSVDVTLTGTGFSAGATVAVSGGVSVSNVTVVNATTITATFTVGAAAGAGADSVTVTTAGGTSDARAFTVTPPAPVLTGITPASGVQGDTMSVTLTGASFGPGATVAVSGGGASGSGVSVSNVTVSSATTITATFTIAATAATGTDSVTVTTAGGTSGAQAFTVGAPSQSTSQTPTLTGISPASGLVGKVVPAVLTGTNFVAGSTSVAVSGAGVSVGTVDVQSATSLGVDFVISSTAALGARNVTVTTPAGTSGAQTFTVRVPPQAVADADTTLEDTQLRVAAPGVLANDPNPSGGTLTAKLVTGPSHGTLVLNSDGSFSYTPAANYNGSDSFTYEATSGGGASAPATVSLTITPVNDAPSYTAGSNQVVWHGAGAQTVTGWATNISPGPANESTQTVAFTVTSSDSSLFSVQPAISSSGSLTFTPDTLADGVDTVSVTLKDNGGTANGGVDSTATQSFTIAVGPVAIVTNQRIGTVSVINLATGTVVHTLTGFSTPDGVAITPDGTTAYVANSTSNSVSVIDVAGAAVTKTITVSGGPSNIAFSPDGAKAYVTQNNADSVAVIDVSTGTVSGKFAVGTAPMGVAFTPDGTKAYVVNSRSNTVSVVDAATDVLTSTIGVGEFPLYVAVSPAGDKAYVSNEGLGSASDSVSVIDVAADTAFKSTIKVSTHPRGIAFTPNGSKAYVVSSPTDYGPGAVSVVDVASNTVSGSPIGTGDTSSHVAFTLDGSTAVVTNFYGSSVSVIDVATGTVSNTITIPGFDPEPEGVAIR